MAALFAASAPVLALEPPNTPAPIPPQPTPAEAVEQEAMEPAAPAVDAAPEAIAPEARAAAAGYLGVGGSQVPELLAEHLKLEPGSGVVVRSLDPAGPAARAGLAHNDVITRISGEEVGSHEQLREKVSALKPGTELDVDYIHQGEAKTTKVILGDAPAMPGAIAGLEPKPLDRLMLDGMPQDQAKRIQDAIQQNLQAFEGLQGQLDQLQGQEIIPEEMLGKEMQKRMQELLKGMQLPDVMELQGGINLKSAGTFRMINPDGSSVELTNRDGSKEVRVLGPGGKVEWEGPYDTPQHKEAVPEEFRERIEKLNIDGDFKGNGFRLHMFQGGPRENK
jgi:membrane-associated protease RseP (regulator of RpoE activity)